ncbi:putative Protein-secreting ATPase [Mesorhizobium escarrei]|uniref:TraD/TraG TraM recognition site domain-containing protein n=1 Tax=Mesorhizobium escarrei TaxID=666018 RepID=A0ABM9E8W9_9HYPH|nr:type IV secretory system conjugative DNA transfer family protein [Mesorhizobium escarrei]CAH2405602.1 putative Protein-secreting ATPase [Mesorhizobium escarrei]
MLTGILLHVVTDLPVERRNLATVREIVNLMAGNVGFFAETLKHSRHPEVRLIHGNLAIGANETLGSIISFAQEGVDFIRGPAVQDVTIRSSFAFDAVTRGSPLSIYLVLPPHMLESHSRLLRLWIGTLLTAVMRRRSRPARPTLFVLDEAAQLGELSELRQAITLLRGYGLQTWSFWQGHKSAQTPIPPRLGDDGQQLPRCPGLRGQQHERRALHGRTARFHLWAADA